MKNFLSLVALVVPDYDPAISFYVDQLGFDLIEDSPQLDGKRWVVVSPKGATESRLLLAKATNADQQRAIGNQTGGRVFLFLQTDDFARDYESMRQRGIVFLEEPRKEPYGHVAVFADPFGNKWDLIEKT